MNAAMREARAEGERLATAATEKAERQDPAFPELAREFVVAYLRRNGPTSSEFITEACKRSGIRPADDRAFGGIYLSLSKRGVIRFVGHCTRWKGHGTSGGKRWELVAPSVNRSIDNN